MKHFHLKAASHEEHQRVTNEAKDAGMTISNYLRMKLGWSILPETSWRAESRRDLARKLAERQ